MIVKDELARPGEQIAHDTLGSIGLEGTVVQCSMEKVSKQVMGEIGEQDVGLLSWVAVFTPGFETQTGFVVAKLFDLGGATIVVMGDEEAFRRQGERADIVAMHISVTFESSLDENTYRAAEVDGGWHFTQPGIHSIGVPAMHAFGKGFGSTVVHAFGHDMIAARQEPAKVIIAATSTIDAPNGTLSLGLCQV